MKGNVFFDTNVLVYLFDKSEKKKHAIAGQLFKQSLEKYNHWISIQVINEFIVIVTRKIKNLLSLKEAKKRISFLADALNMICNSISTCSKSIALMEKYSYSYWDSLIIASALESNCTVLYTEDMQDGQVIDSKLRIMNPFAAKKTEKSRKE